MPTKTPNKTARELGHMVDDRSRFASLLEVGMDETTDGPWRLTRTIGDLGYAGQLVAVHEVNGLVIPWHAISRLYREESD